MVDWRKHLKAHERDRLADMDNDRKTMVIERKRIRDRCYARARRDREQGDK